ncbi:hypothetical protein NH26_19050 [Flammeovirga pacifica]|uniref:RNA polymerase sigma-70 factor n=1 Tax=Flammeovirga pacifica TaxID=915059 RepID=A0A1S1Z5Q7_FLAPC|nr:hypothetical protein NH26_19050 [Flammeovirga pacifica]
MISKEQFEVLFKAQYPKLCAYANTFLKDIQASEDVVHDVLIKLWEQKEQIDIDTSLEAYLFRAVRNKCLNVIRHTEVKENYKVHVDHTSSSQHVEEDLEASELDDKIQSAINQMPDKRKNIFLLSRFEGLKYSEIATQLNISVKTVENQMSSALKYLKTELSSFISIIIAFFSFFFE